MPVKLPLRVKLMLAICLPLLAVYLMVLLLENHISKREALKQMRNYLAEVAAHEAIHLDQQLSAIAQLTRSTARFLQAFPHRESAELERLARANLLAEPQIFGICVALESPAEAGGSVPLAPYVCRTVDGQGLRSMDVTSVDYDYTRSDWYLLPKLLGGPAWTDPYFDEGVGRILMCTYSVPLLRDDDFQGVVTADVSLDLIRHLVSQTGYRGEYRFVISRAGTFVYHPNDSFILAESIFSLAEWYDVPALADLGQAMIHGQQGVVRIPDYETGRPKWCAFADVPSAGWSLAAMIPEKEVLAPVRDQLHRQLCIFVAGLGLILALVVFASRWVTEPLRCIAEGARKVAQGNLQVQVQVQGIHRGDEIGQFAATFNQMVVDLKANIEATIRETNARQTLERELQVARQIQTSLLPRQRPPFPNRHEFSLYADNKPAHFIAGDFFDFWLLDDQHLAVVIADVSGKGVPAAMFMAVTRTTLRNVSGPDTAPREVLTTANRLIAADNEEMMFATIFYGHYHIQTGELVFANAGHNWPYLIRGDGRLEPLGPSTGPMLGVFPEAEYGEALATLDPGELVLLYTDGVTEAYDHNNQFFGEVGLTALLAKVRDQSVEAICRAIVEEVDKHRHHEGQDDVTLVALQRAKDAAPPG